MQDIAGSAAFVTGAASGIGLGIARALAREGARVVMADIRQDAIEEAAAGMRALGAEVLPLVVDVSDLKSVEAAADAAEARFGDIRIVCNNAGVAMHGVPIDEIAMADWDWVIGVNVYGVIHGIRTFVPRMKAHGKSGHVVNTASIGGLQVNRSFLTGAYSMTKYAVVALSEALEQELGEDSGIGVSAFCPAAVDTGIHLSGRARPGRLGGPTVREANHFMGDFIRGGLNPDAAGRRIVRAIRDNEFLILTHPHTREVIEARHRRIQAAYDHAVEIADDGWNAPDGAPASAAE